MTNDQPCHDGHEHDGGDAESETIGLDGLDEILDPHADVYVYKYILFPTHDPPE